MKFNFLRQIPVAKLLLKATDIDEVVASEVSEKTSIAVATALAQVQELKGRKIKFTIEVTVDEILE